MNVNDNDGVVSGLLIVNGITKGLAVWTNPSRRGTSIKTELSVMVVSLQYTYFTIVSCPLVLINVCEKGILAIKSFAVAPEASIVGGGCLNIGINVIWLDGLLKLVPFIAFTVNETEVLVDNPAIVNVVVFWTGLNVV